MPQEMNIDEAVEGVKQPRERNIEVPLNQAKEIRDLKDRIANLEANPDDTIEFKTTAGDFAAADSWNGRRVINTADNNYKIFAEGSFRTITGW